MLASIAATAPPLTIANFIEKAFPQGTRWPPPDEKWALVPIFPTDVFAAASLLVENAGLYQSIYPKIIIMSNTETCIGLQVIERTLLICPPNG
jgi:hypothetical protein